jgi:uncharacterized membrane protein
VLTRLLSPLLFASAVLTASPTPLEEPAQTAAGATWIFVAIAVLAAAVVVIGLVVVLRRGLRRDR